MIFYIDEDFMKGKGIIGIHPNENTAAVWLKVDDLIDLLKSTVTELILWSFKRGTKY